jgi:hypothetical protein
MSERVIAAAVAIAAASPATHSRYTASAHVAWPLLHELRDALTEAGIDWGTGVAKRR